MLLACVVELHPDTADVFTDRQFGGNQLGVLPEPAIPLATIVIAIPAALALANLIAAVPGRAAARTRPATVLRTE